MRIDNQTANSYAVASVYVKVTTTGVYYRTHGILAKDIRPTGVSRLG